VHFDQLVVNVAISCEITTEPLCTLWHIFW